MERDDKEPMTTEQILSERGARYGRFRDHADVSQDLKDVVRDACEARGKWLDADMREALEMICHKMARIINGDPAYPDSWDDIAGYAKLVADRLHGVVR